MSSDIYRHVSSSVKWGLRLPVYLKHKITLEMFVSNEANKVHTTS